jgi:hypothetical protein
MRPETLDESDFIDDVESLNDDEDEEGDYEDEEDPVSNRIRAGVLNTVRWRHTNVLEFSIKPNNCSGRPGSDTTNHPA